VVVVGHLNIQKEVFFLKDKRAKKQKVTKELQKELLKGLTKK